MMMVQIRMGVESWIGNSRILDGVVINCNGKIWGQSRFGGKDQELGFDYFKCERFIIYLSIDVRQVVYILGVQERDLSRR